MRRVQTIWLLLLLSFLGSAHAESEAVRPLIYVTQPGDLLSSVAKKHGSSTSGILKENPGLDPRRLKVGQAFFMPVEGATPGMQVWPMDQEIVRGPLGRKKIALTFDAGGEGKYARQLLDSLAKEDVQCSFFLTGKWAEQFPDEVRIMSASGHSIHNHSYSHPDFTKLTDEQIAEEVRKAEEILIELTGQQVKPWFRFPFGARDSRTSETLAALGYRSVYWSLDSLDAYGEEKTPEFLVQRVTTAGGKNDPDEYLDGAIVLMHAGSATSVQAVPKILAVLKEKGYRIVTVDELVEYEKVDAE